MNINPLYLQEVSREYYTNILNNSRQQKAAAKLTKNWLAKNPTASKKSALDKFSDFSEKVHNKYDKVRNRPDDTTGLRNNFISRTIRLNQKDPKKLRHWELYPGDFKDKAFKTFRREVGTKRRARLRSKITDDIFNL